MFAVSCITPRHTVEINDYILLENGIEILGKEKGLTAFMFENNPRKIPFQQFVADKYNVGSYHDVNYWVTINGNRYKVFVYENSDIEKYFDISEFMVTNVETEVNIVGSKAKFIALSMTDASNEDCLGENSLFRSIAIKHLKQLKDEYLNN
ncbi:hypothetical protein DVK85_05185 [Flavobacterium arcticum]|uniref:Uncharacterized protein n=2 Tax=Flavobacterium arcticum TaxID=1784713 RepID=A0A345HAP8_9FLAO|nr:hypothetical protein [Flavobacterium arcticum]AXG73658.1 hypothetical protein DVK85_05185 [Flavobacterium arcticum]